MKYDNSAWTLITVTFNNAPELRDWWTGTELQGARWIVVDNNSSDGTAAYAETLGADVVRLPENVGFSRANNVGLQMTTSIYVAFVNPDVRIDASSLSALAAIATKRDAIVCPQLCNPDGSSQPNGRGLPFLIDKLAHRGVNLPGNDLRSYVPDITKQQTFVAWAMGAAVCGETARIKSAGGWDERYFLYYEDHSFGLDAWARGQEVIVVPEVRWTHAWKRETKDLRLKPWLREIASAVRFYRRHPILLLPASSKVRRRWRGVGHKFGRAVPNTGDNG